MPLDFDEQEFRITYLAAEPYEWAVGPMLVPTRTLTIERLRQAYEIIAQTGHTPTVAYTNPINIYDIPVILGLEHGVTFGHKTLDTYAEYSTLQVPPYTYYNDVEEIKFDTEEVEPWLP